jgi:hypothetical protein
MRLEQQLKNYLIKMESEGKEPNKNHVRMVNGKIEKQNLRLVSAIDELKKQNIPKLDYNLIAIACLSIQCDFKIERFLLDIYSNPSFLNPKIKNFND